MNRLINLKLNNLTRPSLLKASPFNNVFTRTYSEKIDIEKEVNSKEAKAKRLQRKKTEKTNVISTTSFKHLSLNKVNHSDVPQLCFGLDRALFNPGITFLQDPHSGVYNFSPYLENIVQPDEVDMSKFPDYTPASKDTKLIEYAKKHKLTYTGTTSSVTGLLSHLYFIVSGWKKPTLNTFSPDFTKMRGDYSRTLTTPTTVKLKLNDGIYNIDSDKSFDSGPNILSQLGHIMERMLTQTPAELSRYLKENEKLYPGPIAELDSYQYSATSKIAFRAQLDCSDPRLPRKIFDLKTRSTLPIRLDKHFYKEYLGYELNKQFGVMESFEREYFDMIRNAFLKYSFQVRIGKMDGIMVAYHNTAKIFGFQYISLEEMDSKLFENSVMGNQVFIVTVRLLEKILDKITGDFPGKEVMITFKTKNKSLMMDVFVEVVESKSEDGSETDAFSFVSPQSTLVKYQVTAHSLINGKKIEGPVSLDSSGKDVWRISYDIVRSNKDKLQLYEEYVEVRNDQATFYQSNAAVNEFGEVKVPKTISPLKSLLREISKNNLKDNEKTAEVKGRRQTIFHPLKFRKAY